MGKSICIKRKCQRKSNPVESQNESTHPIADAARLEDEVARDEVVDVTSRRVLVVAVDDAAGQLVGAVAQAVPPRAPTRGARRTILDAAEGLAHDVMHVGEGEGRGAGRVNAGRQQRVKAIEREDEQQVATVLR